jgi:hypothetical protein
LAGAIGALIVRLSATDAASSGTEKVLELVRLTVEAREPSVVPFGPWMRMICSRSVREASPVMVNGT